MSGPAQQTAATALGWLAEGRRIAREVLDLIESGGAARLVTYGISDELAGMGGGTVHTFAHEVPGEAAAQAGAKVAARIPER